MIIIIIDLTGLLKCNQFKSKLKTVIKHSHDKCAYIKFYSGASTASFA